MTDADLDGLIEQARQATSAFIGGDMASDFDLVDHADDFTLMGPLGGETSRGSERDSIAELEAFLRGGEATLEVVETYASGDSPSSSWSSTSTARSGTAPRRTGRCV